MTVYSYPFKNNKQWNKFWSCFDDVKDTVVIDVKSNALIDNKFCKAKLYYRTATFKRKWKKIKPDNKTYVFQIGEHENVHGHFINCDITELLAKNNMIPWQRSSHWAAPSCIDFDRTQKIHKPTVERSEKDCWSVLFGMIKGLRSYDGKNLSSMKMHDWWDVERMHWSGPFNIGHLVGLSEFQEYHQKRFLEFIPDRDGSKGINKVIFSDGNQAALMGHPSMTCTHRGKYFGFEPEGGDPRLFVMDFWTCNGEKLVDNWCQIDMVDLFRSINKEYREYIDGLLC